MKRRQFVASMVALTAFSTSKLAAGLRALENIDPFAGAPMTEPEIGSLMDAAELSPALEKEFTRLFAWMDQAGWIDYLQQVTGKRLKCDVSQLTQQFNESERLKASNQQGFEDFGGAKMLEPGKPALSLLYYALANPRVKLPDEAGQPASAECYPQLQQLDSLENFIYALVPLTESDLDKRSVVLAVFAYEFRPAAKTPHHQHADMVFSRTGISRVGNRRPVWDPVSRRHISRPENATSPQDAAVLPARYGLFLARKVPHCTLDSIGRQRHDDHRSPFHPLAAPTYFLLPFRKLVSGDAQLAGRGVVFSESHRDEKLARLFEMVPYGKKKIEMPPDVSFKLGVPPFTRISCSTTGPTLGSEATKSNITDDEQQLATLCASGSSALLTPVPAPLVREAYQMLGEQKERARFKVPDFISGNFSNRRYTSLKLIEKPLEEAIDLGLTDDFFQGASHTTEYHSGRNGPEFINIRYEVDEKNCGRFLRHLGPDVPNWETIILEGGYYAGLFQDNLCDGCVHASLTPPDSTFSFSSDLKIRANDLAELPILPAFSLVSAPDFYSLVDPGDLDINNLDKIFVEGGTEIVSGARVRANPHIQLPEKQVPAFPFLRGDLGNIEYDVTFSITAVVSDVAVGWPSACTRRNYKRTNDEYPHDYESTNTLPDASSNIFAPGWDVTYSTVRDPNDPLHRREEKNFYFASFGLGSPFPEDMKLCAAANGMWAALSPDASRTFYGNLEKIGTTVANSRKRRPATTVPLLDEELGVHHDSPAVVDFGQSPNLGWDGEQGPFLQLARQGSRQFQINFTDIGKADYVVNACSSAMDIGKLQALTSAEIVDRMDALVKCIHNLPGNRKHPRLSEFWLVSVEQVADWRRGANGYGISKKIFGNDNGWATTCQLGADAGGGFLYVFASITEDRYELSSTDTSSRMLADCTDIYVCQLARKDKQWQLAWVHLDAQTQVPSGKDWKQGRRE